jgi:hypothetical protein
MLATLHSAVPCSLLGATCPAHTLPHAHPSTHPSARVSSEPLLTLCTLFCPALLLFPPFVLQV